MKSKRLFQILVLLALLFSLLGNGQSVRASSVDQSEGHNLLQTQPTVSISVNPSAVTIGGIATATVRLDDVPVEGYTSIELTCTYNQNVVEASNIVVANLFGEDPVTAINGPRDGRFIVAIAGSHGNKAVSSGNVLAFYVRGLMPGQAALVCQASVSLGSNELISIGAYATSLTILGGTSTPSALCDQVELIADVTIPEGTTLPVGSTFRKSWRLKNIGSCTWTTAYQLIFHSGEQMGAISSAQFSRNVVPGQIVDISLDMTAPSVPGSYRGYWMFKNADGQPFGVGPMGNEPWFVAIDVGNATLTPSPTITGTLSVTPEVPAGSPTPSSTPSGSTVTPSPGVIFDFATLAYQATWSSDAGQLPYPGVDSDPNGFVLRLDHPRLENGQIDTRSALLTFPQNVQNGYIQGFYPPFPVQSGDRFRSTIGCEGGATSCYVGFRLDYQVGTDPIKVLWGPFLERYDGQSFAIDLDLSPLAGKDVKFILTVLSAGVATGDRALWVGPAIYRPGATSVPSASPTSTASLTPTLSPTPTAVIERLRYLNTKYWFEFYYPKAGHYADGSPTDNHTRILLPFTPGTNLYDKYLDVTVVENPETCRTPLAATSTVDSVGMIFTGGKGFLYENGHDQTTDNLTRWIALSTFRDRVCVSLDLVLRATLSPAGSTPPPFFDESTESAVLLQVAATFAWLSLPTATPTGSPIPTATWTSTPGQSPTPTSTPVTNIGTITGQVLAGRRVSLDLFTADNWPVDSVLANEDGTFSLTAPAGNYTITAYTFGFLAARGSVTVTGGNVSTKPTITLLAGDINGDLAINQFDALTIGMNYNGRYPESADLNNDGLINVLDLELLAKNYRTIGPLVW